MMFKIPIVFVTCLYLFCFQSCLDVNTDDEQIISGTDSPTNNPDYLDGAILIDSFKWIQIIDEQLLNLYKSVFTRHPQVHGDKIIYGVLDQDGFVALDRFTGNLIWDNRGVFNNTAIAKTQEYNGFIYYNTRGGIRSFNISTGAVGVNYSLSNSNQYLGQEFAIFNDRYYAHLDDFNFSEPIFDEWIVSEMPPLEKNDWVHFNRIEAASNNGFKRGYNFPTFFIDQNGDTTMIYACQESNNLFMTGNMHLISYNLSADSIKWINRNFTPRGGLTKAPLLDEGRLYTLGEENALCLSAESGEIIWEVGAPVIKDKLTGYADFLIHENKMIILGKVEQILCLNKFNGSVVWSRFFEITKPSDVYIGGSNRNTANIYNGKLYYINGWGSLVVTSIDDDNSFDRYSLPQLVPIEGYEIKLFEPSFSNQNMTISEDGVIYTSDGYRFLAFDAPL